MPIAFTHKGITYTADTPKEADEMLALLKEREAQAKAQAKKRKAEVWMEQMLSRASEYRKDFEQLISSYDENKFMWTPDFFKALVNRLGQPQKTALALLVTQRSISDEQLRKALEISNNQALAGILSGISKQATALYIPPRAIFSFENFRSGGKRSSQYLVTDEFRQIAAQMNWPPANLEAPLLFDIRLT
jgi:hypothetical protein